MMENKVFSLIAIANKAGFLFSGEYKCLEKIKTGEAKLIVVAEDAGKNCKKKFSNKSNYYKLDYLEVGTKQDLGHIVGKKEKAVVVITDEGLKNEVLRKVID